MTARKQNPQWDTELAKDRGYVPRPKKRKPKKIASIRAEQKEKRERDASIKQFNYKDRAKRMRGLFGEQFKAKDGYDLRKVGSWTPAQKAKVTKYFRVIAPRITGDFVVKRYRRQDSIDAAVEASFQESKLKGQTGVAFSVLPGDKLEVKIKRGKKKISETYFNKETGEVEFIDRMVSTTIASVKKQGLRQTELKFDKNAFLEDPDLEIDRVLRQTNAQVFRILVGGQQQNKTLTRSMVKKEIFNLIRNYRPDTVLATQDQRSFDEWLNGLVAYDGSKKRTLSGVDKYILRNERQVAKREIARLDKLSKDNHGKGYKKTIDKQIDIRRKRKGKRAITKRERLIGKR